MRFPSPIPTRLALLFFTSLLLCLPLCAHAQNHVLSLDGDGDYVEIADSEVLNDIGNQATMEAWVKPTAFPRPWMFIVYKGDESAPSLSNRSYGLALHQDGNVRLASAPEDSSQYTLNSPRGLIQLNTWYHLAVALMTDGIIEAHDADGRMYGDSGRLEQVLVGFTSDIRSDGGRADTGCHRTWWRGAERWHHRRDCEDADHVLFMDTIG